MPASNKHEVALGITGGIGAYKAVETVRLLVKAGVGVTVILTKNAEQFVTPLTLQTLSGRTVIRDMYELAAGGDIEHIALTRRISLFVVAPATAATLSRLAHGRASDFLSTFYLAVPCPILVFPSMNTRMFNHPATQANLDTLRGHGVRVLEPETGALACGEEGIGRLPDPERIVTEILGHLKHREFWSRQTVLVTAGPTREFLDPARILTNPATGRMGFAVAEEAARRGAKVVLVAGPTWLPDPWGVEVVRVETTEEMRRAVLASFPASTVVVKAAAPADFRPVTSSSHKTRKEAKAGSLKLETTPDILKEIGAKKEDRFLVGFAAETDDLEERARVKLREKRLDLVVANEVGKPGSGFGSETNRAVFIGADGTAEPLPCLTKREVANRLLDRVEVLREVVA